MTGIPFATVTWYVSAGATAAGSLMVWSCIGLILLSSLFSVAGIFAAARYQNRSYEESMKNLENPDDISKLVLSKGLDTGTAFEILSIDIADIDVGRNIGAQLQTLQAEADKNIAQAKAEERRAMAVAREQGCTYHPGEV